MSDNVQPWHHLPGLRGTEEQALLAELAGCPGVHIVATVDHINAPLLWDVKTRAALNWLCHDATTFAPYFAETLDMPPVLMGEASNDCCRRRIQARVPLALSRGPNTPPWVNSLL